MIMTEVKKEMTDFRKTSELSNVNKRKGIKKTCHSAGFTAEHNKFRIYNCRLQY